MSLFERQISERHVLERQVFEHQVSERQVSHENPANDGSCVVSVVPAAQVRRLSADHLVNVRDLLTALDQPSRCARFGWAADDVALGAHARDAIGNARAIFGVFHDRRLRGVLEIHDGGASGSAEVALVVAAEWRRRGFGWMLLQAAMRWAAVANAGTIRLTFSRHNWPMRQLASKSSARFDIVLDEISAVIATPISVPACATPVLVTEKAQTDGEHHGTRLALFAHSSGAR